MLKYKKIFQILFILILSSIKAQNAKFEPPDGKMYHGVGQGFVTGPQEYTQALGDSSIFPLVWDFFFSIPSIRPDSLPSNLKVFRNSLIFLKQKGHMPEISIQFQGPGGASDKDIGQGTWDWVIDSLATIVNQVGAKVFVRPGGEFNGSWNGYTKFNYVKAFRRIVDRFRLIGADSLSAFVWCYEPEAPNDFDAVDLLKGPLWYPGDDYVDWFGLDLFGVDQFGKDFPEFNENQKILPKGKTERFLKMATTKKKPVHLSETTAKGVDITSDSLDGINDWNSWFVPYFEFFDLHPNIKSFNYINWNWKDYTSKPEWVMFWLDARIQNNEYITNQYKIEMSKSKYIHLKSKKVIINSTVGTFEFCAGDKVNVAYEVVNGNLSLDNIFLVELSDDAGDFNTPLNIGTLQSSELTGVITALLPTNLTSASGYRLRVTSSTSSTSIDNGINIKINQLPQALIIGSLSFCKGSSTSLSGLGGNNYFWSNGESTQVIQVTSDGDYILTVADENGCLNSTEAVVSIDSLPSITVAGEQTICTGNSTTLTISGASVCHIWDPQDSLIYEGPGIATLSPAVTTTYTVTADGVNGCISNLLLAISVENCTGIEEQEIKNNFRLYPNPTTGLINIETAVLPILMVEIVDINGNVVYTQVPDNIASSPIIMDIRCLPSGSYTIKMSSPREVFHRKIVKM